MKEPAPELEQMRGYFSERCGIAVAPGEERLILRAVAGLMADCGCRTMLELYQTALEDPDSGFRDRLTASMVSQETSWFRDEACWKALKDEVIPGLVEKAGLEKPVRIWSAGASTGQEAYSLAMLIDEVAVRITDPRLDLHLEVIASDISSAALFLAMSGRYDTIAMGRGLSPERKSRFFRQQGRIWVIADRLRRRIAFKRLNLVDEWPDLPEFDLILCRYVITCATEEFKRGLFARLAGALEPGGLLALGEDESPLEYSGEFIPHSQGGWNFYRKRTGGAA